MKPKTLFLAGLAGVGLVAAAEEIPVKPQIESVGVFKNGLAVVRASFPIRGAGRYRWDEVPRVVHGSLWVESDEPVIVRSTQRVVEVAESAERQPASMQQELAGKDVMVTLKSAGDQVPAVIGGKVCEPPAALAPRTWDTHYSSLTPEGGGYYGWRNYDPFAAAGRPDVGAGSAGFLVVQDAAGGRRYIDRGSIAIIGVPGAFTPASRREERPVLMFDVRAADNNGTVTVTYLTKGLAWMPAYQVDLSDPAKLKIRQNAVLRNEMADLTDTEVQLISGYPNVRFGSVDSPLSAGSALATFFQQINQSTERGGAGNNVMGQMVYSNAMSRREPESLPDVSEAGNASGDIHFQSIARQDLKLGDSLSLDVAAATAAYERVVEWVVADPRDSNGRSKPDPARDDSPWDAVCFANPFKFPMTTAAATVVEKGRFRGQSQSQWVNPGQRTCLHITKALSVRTEASETEEEGQREIVWIGGNDYQRTKVKGRLMIQNFRGTEVTLAIRCQLSGELLDADADPKTSLRPEGVASVNPRRQLEWSLKLPAGAQKELGYHYQVLVDR